MPDEKPLNLLATMPFETVEGSVTRANTATQLSDWCDRVRMFASGAAGLCADEDWAASVVLSMGQGKLEVPEFRLSGSRSYGINDAHEFLRKIKLLNEAALELLRHSPTASLLTEVSGLHASTAPKTTREAKDATTKAPPEAAPLIWFKNRYGLSDASNLKGAGAVVFSLLARAIDSVRIVHAAKPRKSSNKVDAAVEKLAKREEPFLSDEVFMEATKNWDKKEVRRIYDKWGKDLFKRIFTSDAGSGAISLAGSLLPLLPPSTKMALSSKPGPGAYQAAVEKLMIEDVSDVTGRLRELASRHLYDEGQRREHRKLYFRELASHGPPSPEGHREARKKVAEVASTSVISKMDALDREVGVYLKEEKLFRRIHDLIVLMADPAFAATSMVQSDVAWKRGATAEIEHALERGLDRLKLLVSSPLPGPSKEKLHCNNPSLVVNLHNHWMEMEIPGIPQPGYLDWARSIAR